MVTLKEIQKNDKHARCVVYVEDSNKGIPVEYDFNTSSLSDYSLPQGYEWCTSHMGYVRRFLASTKDAKNVLKEKRIAWY